MENVTQASQEKPKYRRKPPKVEPIIYALSDPRGDEPIRYVGQSKHGLDRPKRHSMEYSLRKNCNPHLCNWIRSLKRLGLKPKIEILEEVATPEELDEAEIFHIAYWRFLGFDLVNICEGGNRPPSGPLSEERKQQISQFFKGKPKPYLKGKPQSEEHKAKRSAAMRGIKMPPRDANHTKNNALAQGGRPFTDGKQVFYTKPEAARILGCSVDHVKRVLRGWESRIGIKLSYIKGDVN